MSNDVPPNDSNHFLAKKRLAQELRIFVIVQTVALSFAALGAGIVLIDLGGDVIAPFCVVLIAFGMMASFLMAFWGYRRLSIVLFLPALLRIYAYGGYFLLFVLLFTAAPWTNHYLSPNLFTFAVPLIFIVPFYGLIPQFFIARWLARQRQMVS